MNHFIRRQAVLVACKKNNHRCNLQSCRTRFSFRGGNERFGSFNNGNHLGLLELVAKFDSFLLAHINRYRNSGSGNLSYLF